METPREASSDGGPATTLCRANCGFYGSSNQDGFCSKCFKDAIKKNQEPPAPSTSSSSSSSTPINIPTIASAPTIVQPSPTSSAASLPEPSSDASLPSTPSAADLSPPDGGAAPPPAKKKNRCGECKKKVGLTGFECRCGGVFCPLHRYSDTHKCSFDYKALGEEEIRKNNPLVAAEKIQKI